MGSSGSFTTASIRSSISLKCNRLPQLPPGQRFILSVSRLSQSEKYKGLDTAILAIARASESATDIRLKIVGSGDDRSRLEALARSVRVSDRVEFLGSVPDDALASLYQECAFFTLPSKKEGFGLVFLEAMARSRAVVASDAGRHPGGRRPEFHGIAGPVRGRRTSRSRIRGTLE